MASAASGDASPRERMSFLLSNWIAPEDVSFCCTPVRSAFSRRSGGSAADFSQSRIAPQSSARLFMYMIGVLDAQAKLTPRTLYRCSLSRSRMPYPRPPSSITVSVGLNSSMASMMQPTVCMVSWLL